MGVTSSSLRKGRVGVVSYQRRLAWLPDAPRRTRSYRGKRRDSEHAGMERQVKQVWESKALDKQGLRWAVVPLTCG